MARSPFLASVASEESEPARVVVDGERVGRSRYLGLWERPGVRRVIRVVSAGLCAAVFVAAGRSEQPLGILLSPVVALLLTVAVWQIRRDFPMLAKGAVWGLTHFAWFFAMMLVGLVALMVALLALSPNRSLALAVGVLMLVCLASAKGVLSDAAGGRQVRLRAAWLLHLLTLFVLGLWTVLMVATVVDSSGVRNPSGVMATVGVAVTSALLLSARSWAARNRKVRTRALESVEEVLMVFDVAEGFGLDDHRAFCRAVLALDRALGSGVDLGTRWMRTPLETPSYRVVMLRFACAHSGHGLLHDVNRPAGLRAIGYCETLPNECDASIALKAELRRLAGWLRRDVDVTL